MDYSPTLLALLSKDCAHLPSSQSTDRIPQNTVKLSNVTSTGRTVNAASIKLSIFLLCHQFNLFSILQFKLFALLCCIFSGAAGSWGKWPRSCRGQRRPRPRGEWPRAAGWLWSCQLMSWTSSRWVNWPVSIGLGLLFRFSVIASAVLRRWRRGVGSAVRLALGAVVRPGKAGGVRRAAEARPGETGDARRGLGG